MFHTSAADLNQGSRGKTWARKMTIFTWPQKKSDKAMPKVTITLEDIHGGAVKVTVEPNMKSLIEKIHSGRDISPAEGYAFRAVRSVHQDSRSQAKKLGLVIPSSSIRL